MSNLVYDFNRVAPMMNTNSKIELAARFGYAAKGLVYGTVGVLALMAVFGFVSGEVTGTRGALEAFNGTSWGPAVLALLATGLSGFTLWRLTQAFTDTEDKGSSPGALIQRTGLMVSGLTYASLAYYALKLLLDSANTQSSPEEKAATVMAMDGGVALIGVVAAVVIGVGLYQLYRAFSGKFKHNWKTAGMSEREESVATAISRVGISARAISFLMIGGFLARAALTAQPDQAQGLQGALVDLGQTTSGHWLLGLAGLGLLCYGVYCFVNALFRDIDAG